MNATAASNPTLQLCDGAIIERCYTDFGWKYLILTINALSVVINLVHMILMSRLPSLHNTSYHFILQQISIADIYAVIPSVTFLCSVHKLYYGQDLRIAAIYAIIIEHCGMVKYNTLFIASHLQVTCPSAILYQVNRPIVWINYWTENRKSNSFLYFSGSLAWDWRL